MKAISTSLLFSLSLCVSAQVFSMDLRSYFDTLTRMDLPFSFDTLTRIDTKNKMKFESFVKDAINIDPQPETKKIKEKFEQLHKKITERAEDQLLNIKKKYVESDSLWNTYKNIALQLNAFEEKHKHLAIASSAHDPNIPAYMNLMLKKNFKKKGMNPERFNISLAKNTFHTSSPSMSFSIEASIINGLKVTTPGTICMPSNCLGLSVTEQEGFCIAAINGARLASSPRNLILFLLTNLTENPYDVEKTDQETFRTVGQNTSDLICALQNKNDCKALKAYYKISLSCYSLIWLESYKLLSKINRLHKALEWLTRYAV